MKKFLGALTLLLLFPAYVQAAPLSGTFLFLGSEGDLSISQIPDFIQEIKSLDMNTLVVTPLYLKSGCGSSSTYSPSPSASLLPSLMVQAKANNIQIYIGIVNGLNGCPGDYYSGDNWMFSPANADSVESFTRNVVNDLVTTYGQDPTLAGWYIPDEPGLAPYTQPNFPPDPFLLAYYRKYNTGLHATSSLPTLVAPGPGDTNPDPVKLAEIIGDFLDFSGINIIVLQDSAGGTDILGLRPNRYSILDYYTAISQMIGKSRLWADLELGNCCTIGHESNPQIWQSGAYQPSTISRIDRQVQLAPLTLVDRRIAWLAPIQMGSISPIRMATAQRLLASYKAQYTIAGQMLKPFSYTWISQPSLSYPDSDNTKLFDNKTANPNDFGDANWAGITGNAEVDVTLDQKRIVDWVAVHVLNTQVAAIYFPNTLEVSCSTDSTTWQHVGSWNLPVQKIDSEYVFSNTTPLGTVCKAIKVKLLNTVTAWTFLSEIEISGPTSILGDINQDGKVDIFDHNLLVADFGKSGSLPADLDNNGKVDIFDYNVLVGN